MLLVAPLAVKKNLTVPRDREFIQSHFKSISKTSPLFKHFLWTHFELKFPRLLKCCFTDLADVQFESLRPVSWSWTFVLFKNQ